VGDWSRVAFAEEDELQHVPERVSFGPSEIDVGNLSGLVANVEQESRDRVRQPCSFGLRPLANQVTAYLYALCSFRFYFL
jgi:hypothetical protein